MASMTDRKSPIEQALDLFFYAPLGLLMNAQEVVPQLIEKGHQQVVVARMFGKFAVEQEAPKQIASLQKQVQKVAEQLAGRGSRPSTSAPKRVPPSSNGAQDVPATQTSAPVVPPAAHGPGAAALAIPGVESAGTMFRCDGVPLALRPPITSILPTDLEALHALKAAIRLHDS